VLRKNHTPFIHMSSRSKDSLYELIQSLTKSEKRYFKLLSSRHTIGEENNYIILFDYIDKQTTYDEKALFKNFQGEAFINKFSITKKRLYDHILHALTNFHNGHHVEAQIYGMIHSADILFEKSLYDQARKTLRSAEKLAVKHQLTNAIVEIRKKGKKLLEKNNYFDLDNEELLAIQSIDQEFHLQSRYEDELWVYKSMIFQRLSRQGVARTEQNKVIYSQYFEEFLTLTKPKKSTFEAAYLENHIRSAYYFAVHDLLESYLALKQNRLLFKENAIQIEDHPDRYFSILTNLIYTADKLGDYDSSILFLEELRQLHEGINKDAEQDLKVKLFATLASIELTFYTKRGDFDIIKSRLPQMEKEIENQLDKITTLRKAFLYFKISTVQLAFGEPNTALKNIRKLLNDTQLDKKEDIVAFAHFMEIFIQIELGNLSTLPYLVKGTQRFLKSRNRLYPFEQELLSFASKFTSVKNPFDAEERWQDLYKSLKSYENESSLQLIMEYFDFTAWAQSKIDKHNFIDIIRGKFSATMSPAA
jgi:hypothetical protein